MESKYTNKNKYLDMDALTDELCHVPYGKISYDRKDDILYINIGIDDWWDLIVPDDHIFNPEKPIIEIYNGVYDDECEFYREDDIVGLIIPNFSKFLNN